MNSRSSRIEVGLWPLVAAMTAASSVGYPVAVSGSVAESAEAKDESAARWMSFSRAADDLNVTQSAISRQIRVLEDQLEQSLFVRAGPKLRLTPAGERLQPKVVEALSILRRATAEVRDVGAVDTLTVSVLPTFATRWLVPRIADFERTHPQISLRLAASYQVVDLVNRPDVDVAIRLGRGSWPGVQATRLTELDVFPVCSPRTALGLRRMSDMQRQTLLTEEPRFDEWSRWFKAAGIDYEFRESRYVDDDAMLLSAAIAGQGITLARSLFAAEDLAAGRLVQPFDVRIRSAFQYYLVCLAERLEEPQIRAFTGWLSDSLS